MFLLGNISVEFSGETVFADIRLQTCMVRLTLNYTSWWIRCPPIDVLTKLIIQSEKCSWGT